MSPLTDFEASVRTAISRGLVLNKIVSPIVMGGLFFGALVPIGWYLRKRGADLWASSSTGTQRPIGSSAILQVPHPTVWFRDRERRETLRALVGELDVRQQAQLVEIANQHLTEWSSFAKVHRAEEEYRTRDLQVQ
jgi:hypothetical protein